MSEQIKIPEFKVDGKPFSLNLTREQVEQPIVELMGQGKSPEASMDFLAADMASDLYSNVAENFPGRFEGTVDVLEEHIRADIERIYQQIKVQ